jgi:hypothetical protein
VAEGPLADELITFIIEKKLVAFHLKPIEASGL